jgi:hypothetical protein
MYTAGEIYANYWDTIRKRSSTDSGSRASFIRGHTAGKMVSLTFNRESVRTLLRVYPRTTKNGARSNDDVFINTFS